MKGKTCIGFVKGSDLLQGGVLKNPNVLLIQRLKIYIEGLGERAKEEERKSIFHFLSGAHSEVTPQPKPVDRRNLSLARSPEYPPRAEP